MSDTIICDSKSHIIPSISDDRNLYIPNICIGCFINAHYSNDSIIAHENGCKGQGSERDILHWLPSDTGVIKEIDALVLHNISEFAGSRGNICYTDYLIDSLIDTIDITDPSLYFVLPQVKYLVRNHLQQISEHTSDKLLVGKQTSDKLLFGKQSPSKLLVGKQSSSLSNAKFEIIKKACLTLNHLNAANAILLCDFT
jgi:hypothetical protein